MKKPRFKPRLSRYPIVNPNKLAELKNLADRRAYVEAAKAYIKSQMKVAAE